MIFALDDQGRPLVGSHYERIDPLGAEGESLDEATWDRIIGANCGALAQALKVAGLIAQESTLVVLGYQVDQVDLLLAEVSVSTRLAPDDSTTWSEPLRLVLLEDKLLRNPEAKRKVLAQILDYAETSKVEWSAASLAKDPKLSKHAEWIQKSRRQIDTMLATNDILLVIAGDEISEGLLRLARRFAASDEPTNLSELCLVSMALYGRGAERLLIPHVVSAVQRYQRQATVRITVAGQASEEHIVSVTRARDADVEAKLRGAPQTNIAARLFLEKARSKLEPEASAPQYEVTRKLRKLLEYCPSGAESRLRYKIHFGGSSPILGRLLKSGCSCSPKRIEAAGVLASRRQSTAKNSRLERRCLKSDNKQSQLWCSMTGATQNN